MQKTVQVLDSVKKYGRAALKVSFDSNDIQMSVDCLAEKTPMIPPNKRHKT